MLNSVIISNKTLLFQIWSRNFSNCYWIWNEKFNKSMFSVNSVTITLFGHAVHYIYIILKEIVVCRFNLSRHTITDSPEIWFEILMLLTKWSKCSVHFLVIHFILSFRVPSLVHRLLQSLFALVPLEYDWWTLRSNESIVLRVCVSTAIACVIWSLTVSSFPRVCSLFLLFSVAVIVLWLKWDC